MAAIAMRLDGGGGDAVAVAAASGVDPLGFLAGRRYTCYCGRTVVGSILCRDCAEEMTAHFLRRSRLRIMPQMPA
jgi:hypothetical protein